MEFGKFRRGDRDDLNNDRGENNDRGGDRPRYSDRGGDRSRYSDRPRYGDRNDRSGGGRRFGSDRGGDRPRYGERGGFDRDRSDRGGDTEESVFSKKVRAGKRRTYFLDVRNIFRY